MKLIDPIVQFQHEIRALRREIHAHPELKFEEHRTADLVAAKLEQWGIAVHRGLGGTGVVGTIKKGSGRRSLGLRADMDALPLQELNSFAHRSVHDGRMHACGHDGHTAMLLAAARFLAGDHRFDGTVQLIFQPAEEGGGGAKAMIDDGLFDQFPCDAVFGMHNWPGARVGSFGVTAGPMMASSNEFNIRIAGRGAHAALPNDSVDPIIVGCHLVQAFQTIISRNKKPIDAGVLSVTQIHSGSATNIIPDSAELVGTVRTFSIETLDLIESKMRKLTAELCGAFGATAQFEFQRNYPPTINHAEQTKLCAEVARSIVGQDQVNDAIEPVMGSEDFAYMLLKKPGCYIFIGNGDGSHRDIGHGPGPCQIHNPSYDFNDDLIPIGATYWVGLVDRMLGTTG